MIIQKSSDVVFDGRGEIECHAYAGAGRVADTQRGRCRVAFNWDRKTHFVGYFDDEEEAAQAYNAAVLPLPGEFARLNFPAAPILC